MDSGRGNQYQIPNVPQILTTHNELAETNFRFVMCVIYVLEIFLTFLFTKFFSTLWMIIQNLCQTNIVVAALLYYYQHVLYIYEILSACLSFCVHERFLNQKSNTHVNWSQMVHVGGKEMDIVKKHT
jgi:hypothetical protein